MILCFTDRDEGLGILLAHRRSKLRPEQHFNPSPMKKNSHLFPPGTMFALGCFSLWITVFWRHSDQERTITSIFATILVLGDTTELPCFQDYSRLQHFHSPWGCLLIKFVAAQRTWDCQQCCPCWDQALKTCLSSTMLLPYSRWSFSYLFKLFA